MVETAVEAPFQVFQTRPQLLESGKISTRLAKTDLISAGVQVIGSGGETNLHSHTNQDEIWFVLSGEAKFYTVNDRVVATLGKFEGIIVPHGAPYWFESSSEENLVLMRFGANVPGVTGDGRIDYSPRNFSVLGEEGIPHPAKPIEGKFFGD